MKTVRDILKQVDYGQYIDEALKELEGVLLASLPEQEDHYPNIEEITVDSGVVVTREGYAYGYNNALSDTRKALKEVLK